jgi:hypothetical protein
MSDTTKRRARTAGSGQKPFEHPHETCEEHGLLRPRLVSISGYRIGPFACPVCGDRSLIQGYVCGKHETELDHLGHCAACKAETGSTRPESRVWTILTHRIPVGSRTRAKRKTRSEEGARAGSPETKAPPLRRKRVPRFMTFEPEMLHEALPGHMALPRTRAEAIREGANRFFPYDEATKRLRICDHDHVAAHSVKGGCCECIRLADLTRKASAKARQSMIDRKLRAAFIKLDMETQKGFLVDAMAHRLAKGRLVAQGIKHRKVRDQMIARGLTPKQRRNAYDRNVSWYKKEVSRTATALSGEPEGKQKTSKPRGSSSGPDKSG